METTFAQPKGAGTNMAMWSAREQQMRQDSRHANKSIVTFGDALKRVRIQMGWSHRTLAHAIGKSVDDIKDMEGGRLYPKGRDKPRLKGVMEGIRQYMHLIPQQDDSEKSESEPDPPIEIIADPNPAVDEIANNYTLPEEVPIDFSTFGNALKGLRIREGLEHGDVAQLCATTDETISQIEGGTLPIDARVFEKLIVLFDELKTAPEPTLMHLQIVPDPAKDTAMPQPDDPTLRWVAATKKAAVASKKVARLEAELKAAREAFDSATLERDMAQQEIEQAALEEAGE